MLKLEPYKKFIYKTDYGNLKLNPYHVLLLVIGDISA